MFCRIWSIWSKNLRRSLQLRLLVATRLSFWMNGVRQKSGTPCSNTRSSTPLLTMTRWRSGAVMSADHGQVRYSFRPSLKFRSLFCMGRACVKCLTYLYRLLTTIITTSWTITEQLYCIRKSIRLILPKIKKYCRLRKWKMQNLKTSDIQEKCSVLKNRKTCPSICLWFQIVRITASS